MTPSPVLPPFLWQLFQRLRRRGFALGPTDYEALRQALRAGFGWTSRESLRDLCNSLWAKSQREQETLTALFEQLAPDPDDWQYSLEDDDSSADGTESPKSEQPDLESKAPNKTVPRTESRGGLPSISLADVKVSERPFVFVPQFPLTYREVAQTWRRLRRPVRFGAPIELDIEGTITRRSRLGVATTVVLQPRRRNMTRLLLLVDRQGSMDPFHRFCDEVCTAIQQAGRLEETALYYFHNVPAEGADEQVLEALTGQLFPVLDPVLPQIQPLTEGCLYSDPDLLSPKPLADVLQSYAVGGAVVLISDAGAARNRYRISRLLDTIAFMKALRTYTSHYVWLNPLPKRYWLNNTAAHIARHVPMFPLDLDGIQRAVNVLRGQQHIIERPL
ncbi:VWA domain-containing protein [Kovacikia minuta CCNUW1]|uniref:VWA domain-containing protein n=1 Tax=Kovacikia minuta TaxID=2931930 RepID=UPI001CCB1BF9|nr:VWA domain-containing protein [Kovacikia minuta]UBF28528.1 VWA domain-containing protein [Kovacikia minuta CCNUW1]